MATEQIGEFNSLESKDQRRFALVHLRLKSALVKGLSQRSDTTARSSPCDKTGATLEEKIFSILRAQLFCANLT